MRRLTSWWFVLAEGVKPEDLPGRLAAGNEAVLDAPMACHEARRRLLRGRTEFSSHDDKALMAVGRAGTHWSFAFEGDPAHPDPQRFLSPAAAAAAAAASGTERAARCRTETLAGDARGSARLSPAVPILVPAGQVLVSSLNAAVTLADLAQDISETGHPQPARQPTASTSHRAPDTSSMGCLIPPTHRR